jgi:hypothetical protein
MLKPVHIDISRLTVIKLGLSDLDPNWSSLHSCSLYGHNPVKSQKLKLTWATFVIVYMMVCRLEETSLSKYTCTFLFLNILFR